MILITIIWFFRLIAYNANKKNEMDKHKYVHMQFPPKCFFHGFAVTFDTWHRCAQVVLQCPWFNGWLF